MSILIKFFSRFPGFTLFMVSAGIFILVGIALSSLMGVSQKQDDASFKESFTAEKSTAVSVQSTVALVSEYSLDEQENIRIYQEMNEAVVNISTEVLSYNWFLEAIPQAGGAGSGSIIDKKGYVLTNNHVVADAVKVTITLYNGSIYEGTIIGRDIENDLAVVQFDPQGKELKTIPLGTSRTLKVGQKVLAIGNPFALGRTLTTGVVSALGRPLRSENGLVLHQLIQTDASINPGNSGGPLFNSKGQMIGINTMIYSPSRGSVGIGFAVPIDTAKRVVPDLIKYGKVIRGWIDIVPVQIFPRLVAYARLSVSKGILVSQVAQQGQAQKAGLQGGSPKNPVRYGNDIIYLGGDIITAINGQDVATLADLYSILESTKPGDTVRLSVVRHGQKKEINVVLVNRSQQYEFPG